VRFNLEESRRIPRPVVPSRAIVALENPIGRQRLSGQATASQALASAPPAGGMEAAAEQGNGATWSPRSSLPASVLRRQQEEKEPRPDMAINAGCV
jgi:hypothetical protein